MGSIQNELSDFYINLREITFRLTNVIPKRIIFVSRGITAHAAENINTTRTRNYKTPQAQTTRVSIL